MRRWLGLLAFVAILLAVATASAAHLEVDGGTIQYFEFTAGIPTREPSPTPTIPPADPGCTYSTGYWKNHPEAWSTDRLALGATEYLQPDLLALLERPIQGDALLNLAQQLIAAKLNALAGAGTAAVSDTLEQADGLLDANPIGTDLKKNNAARKEANQLAGLLEDYNTGETGPGHCTGEEEPPQVDAQPLAPLGEPLAGLPTLPPPPTPTHTPSATLQTDPTATQALPTATQPLPTSTPFSPTATLSLPEASPTIPPPAEPELPTSEPIELPTASPTETPLPQPTATPLPEPTSEPAVEPTTEPPTPETEHSP